MASVAAFITGPIIDPLLFRAFCIFRAIKYETFKVSKFSLKNSIIALLITISVAAKAQNNAIVLGADKLQEYLPLLKEKNVAVVANQTTVLSSGVHLVDALLLNKIAVKKVFSPEHGFRGTASAGEKVDNGKDEKTGLPIVSLYGKNKKPSAEMLKDVDVVVFDIQDVGARFYTYISTMSLVMEACAENDIEVVVLDRPNPNGHYVDGPVLQKGFESFVGMHKIPIVHGMTIGEYALMVNYENWLPNGIKCKLKVIVMDGYDHTKVFSVPIAPSPNLPNDEAIRLYPSLCLFEGTTVSVGRGTPIPFQQIGAPWLKAEFGNYSFTPTPNEGAKHPKYENEKCYGIDLKPFANGFLMHYNKLYIYWLIESYGVSPDKDKFFTSFFDKLAGNDVLRQQIILGVPEEEIRASWQADLNAFKLIRKKYLLYADFE